MIHKSNWGRTKTIVTVTLAVLIAANLAVGFLFWQSSRQNPAEMRAQLDRLQLEAKLRQADIQRARKIRASLPQVGKDCDAFYRTAFLDGASGYSSVDADLSAIADKAGLHIADTSYRETNVDKHGVKEIGIATTVEGSYTAIIQFIGGLERSRNFYLLNDLSLTSAKAGTIRLQLKLRTFFRS
jgi:Tfp pilus assembly protein PilO